MKNTDVAIVLYYLVDQGRMREIADAFGISKCTVSKIIYMVTKAINIYIYMGPNFVKLSITEQEVTEVCRRFWKKVDSCNVLGLQIELTFQ